jgi:hypothetical protein
MRRHQVARHTCAASLAVSWPARYHRLRREAARAGSATMPPVRLRHSTASRSGRSRWPGAAGRATPGSCGCLSRLAPVTRTAFHALTSHARPTLAISGMDKAWGRTNVTYTASVVRQPHGYHTSAASVTLRSEDRDSTPTRRPYGTLFSMRSAVRVQVETAYSRPVTRERMAMLCRGSND